MSDDDDKPGYGKPPKQYQFKPGQSGNPKGRKKGSRGLKTDLRAELRSKVAVTENGRTKQLTKQQLILKSLATKAAKGDVKAIGHIVSMTMQMFGIEDERTGKSQLSAADEALLADYLANNSGPSEPPADWPTEPVSAPTPDNISDITENGEEPEDSDVDVGGGDGDEEPDLDDVEDYDADYDDDY